MFHGLLFSETSGTYHQLSRLQSLTQWWQWLLLVFVVGAIAAYVVVVYRRDAVELRRGVAWTLLLLRVLAFLGVLFFFLDLERRTERRVTKDSRVVVMVDTSQSMGLPADTKLKTGGPSRLESVATELADGDLVKKLRALHEVVVYRFDQGTRPIEIAAYPKLVTEGSQPAADRDAIAARQARSQASIFAWCGVGLLAVSVIAGVLGWFGVGRSKDNEGGSWTWLVSTVTLVATVVLMGIATLRSPDFDLIATLTGKPSAAESSGSKATDGDKTGPKSAPEIDWRAELTPRGTETRLGDAIEFVVNKERGGPIAGIVVLTDGGRNAGQPYEIAAATAQDAGVPLYPVGLGSDQRPMNVKVVDLEAPQRVYPGDKFTLTGMIQGFGLAGRSVKVELLESKGATDAAASGTMIDERRVQLGADGDILPVKFEATPEEPGQITYKVRVSLNEPDHDPKDNEKIARVQVVERKNRVLLIAGGPAREYQFLKNLLYRDKDTTLHVWLQSGTEGMSQEAHELLYDFPATAEELFEYDCIVAFDPNWEDLDGKQIELLERWVAEEAGGLVVVAGPVFTPQWSSRRPSDRVGDPEDKGSKASVIKALYPVAFYYQGAATLSLGRFGGDKAWPLQFTRDGLDAEFLWLGESASESETSWNSFDGVYGYYAVKDPKPGARVYARFGDPDTEIDGELPIYLAGHFYGAGRVFFQASGEMWRIRAVDDNYYDQYYTKLLRWASQGRLSRDSSRGVLLVDKERCLLGDQVALRAVLKDAQLRPLTVDEIQATLVTPDGGRQPIKLRKLKDSSREGMYSGEFTALLEGDYRVELKPPESGPEDLLTREVRVRMPSLESEKPERNDPLLKDLAERTGGEYFIGIDSAMNRDGGGRAVAQLIEPQDQVTYLSGSPDRNFERTLMGWLMCLICGVLSFEWLVRRLSRLS
ncbi:MAG TPA: VWA domain-containing protein [Pirellulaceae bacterium]|nr:VWA domain-containing protein [Pirellulaceae bacterium]